MSFPGESDPFIASSEVIGIARDVRSLDLRKIDESYLYLPLSQSRQWTRTLLVRTGSDPRTLLPAIGHEVRRLDANIYAPPLAPDKPRASNPVERQLGLLKAAFEQDGH